MFVTPQLAHLAPKLTAVNQSVKKKRVGGGLFLEATKHKDYGVMVGGKV